MADGVTGTVLVQTCDAVHWVLSCSCLIYQHRKRPIARFGIVSSFLP